MKRLGITSRLLENTNYAEVREALDIRWASLVGELNCLPIILPINSNFIDYFEEFDLKGVLLTGGNDLNIVSSSDLSRKRDEFEKEIMAYSIAKDIPILGVCRGMQVITDYFGGNLVFIEGHVAVRHKLKVNPKSRYSKELFAINDVNSYHNYSVSDAPKEFEVSATDEQGVVKAIESRAHKIFGQMWHSERESPLDLNQLALMKKALDL